MKHKKEEIPYRIRSKQRKDAYYQKLYAVIQGIGFLLSLFKLYYYNYSNELNWGFQKVIGFIIFILSFSLWLLSRLELADSFSLLPQASNSTGLKTRGIYAYISHPIYLFSCTAIIGYILLINQLLIGILIILIIIPIQLFRIKKENYILLQTFGDEYNKYKRNTWI